MERFEITEHPGVGVAPSFYTIIDRKTGERYHVTGEANLRALLERLLQQG